MTDEATRQSYQRLIAVEPAWTRIAPLRELRRLPAKTLLHAGPPFRDVRLVPAALRHAICAAIILDGWASSYEAAAMQLDGGDVILAAAQDYGVVTPLAFVAGPSTYCLEVADLNQPDRTIVSPLNDGPAPGAIRFGVCSEESLAVVQSLRDGIGANLAQALEGPLELLPLMAEALTQGDDLHGHVAAFQERILPAFRGSLMANSEAYLGSVGQFALNISMAASALMIGAGADVADSRMVVASGGNGVEIGYKLASDPSRWQVVPATQPIGPRLAGREDRTSLPAIGDSAVIDALGLGAACLRCSPTLSDALSGHIERGEVRGDHLVVRAHEAFIGVHPGLPIDGLRVGLDLERPRSCLGIMLGMVDSVGEVGLIGRGIAPWPESDGAS
ncbi:MAG: DUF1116 domain-containing protein [Pseudomonadota bacterium]